MEDNSPVKISVVSYLNSKPFIYGLRKANFKIDVQLSEDIPSVCADKLINGEADIGLVPVIIIPKLKRYSIISDYCIGADGPVQSVLLLSDVPLDKIENILLDYQSRTSSMLTRVLASNFWKINPRWTNGLVDYEKNISDSTAGVVIGDRALLLKNNFRFVYDLSDEWKKFTSLPFVFACWASTRVLDDGFVDEFNAALLNGLNNISEISITETSTNFSAEEIQFYLTKCIDFKFDSKKKEALDLFLKLSLKIEFGGD